MVNNCMTLLLAGLLLINNEITPKENNGKFVVYASDYAKLNSDVEKGGGDDDTEILQAILNKAPEWGGLHLRCV